MTHIYTDVYWRIRSERMLFAGYKCETCKRGEWLECHHANSESYQRDRNGTLQLTDVVILCVECHDAITNVQRGRRYEERATFKETGRGNAECYSAFDRADSAGTAQRFDSLSPQKETNYVKNA
jgi:hypothetical protein